jgi:hypothetical protein
VSSPSNPIDFATLKLILPLLDVRDAVLLRGPHGIGKSAVPASVAAAEEKKLLDVRLSLYTEGDLIGVPDQERIKVHGVTSFAPPDWLWTACHEPCILFLDEINRALIGVQNSAFQLVLDRQVKGMMLHPETRVFAAINDSPEYTVNEMDPALLDRFITYDLTPTVQDWIDWAHGSGIDAVIVDFIRNHPEHLRPTKAVEPGKVTPTQRSWARLDRNLKNARMNPSSIAGNKGPPGFYAICMGLVGVEAAIAFNKFVEDFESNITAEDILDRWKKVKSKVEKLPADQISGIIAKLGEHAKENIWTDAQVKNASDFSEVISGELLMSMWSAVSGGGKQQNTINFHRHVAGRIMQVAQKANSIKK